MPETFFASRNSLDTYKQCKFKFFLRYCKKAQGFVDSDDKKSALFGSVIHRVQELYHANPELDILTLYKDEFKASDLTDEDFFNIGYNMVEDFTKDAASGKKILGLELPFEIYLTNGIPVKGIIDRVDEISKDEIEVIDYKTGRYSLTEEELKKDLQLGLYDIVIRQLYPQYKNVKLTLNYLHYGKVSVYKTDEERERLEAYIAVLYDKVASSLANASEATMPPRINSLCSFCEFKSQCPEFQKLVVDKKQNPDEFMGLISKSANLVIAEEEISDFISQIKAKVKILKDMQDQASNYIKERIKATGGEKASLGNKTYYLARKKFTKYDVNTVIDIFKNKKVDLNLVLEPLKTQIDNMVKNDEEAMSKLNSSAKTQYSDSYVK